MATVAAAMKPDRLTNFKLFCASEAEGSDLPDRRSAHAERAMDDLRQRFGRDAVIKGIAYEGPEKSD